MKHQGNRTNVGQENSTALTGIVHTLNLHQHIFQLLRCVIFLLLSRQRHY